MKKVFAGDRFAGRTMTGGNTPGLDPGRQTPPQELLSSREFQVFQMIASGKTVTAISRELSLSVKTVSTYRTRLLRKMEMTTNGELADYAARHPVTG